MGITQSVWDTRGTMESSGDGRLLWNPFAAGAAGLKAPTDAGDLIKKTQSTIRTRVIKELGRRARAYDRNPEVRPRFTQSVNPYKDFIEYSEKQTEEFQANVDLSWIEGGHV